MAAKHGTRSDAPRAAKAAGLTLANLVERAAEEMRIPLSARAQAAIDVWLARLEEWNARIDLTAARTPEELVDLMIADALFLSQHLPQGARVVDVGSGAGAPGLALALVRDDLRMTLVEPLGKRAAFLRTAAGATGRPDIAVDRSRGESLAGRRAWDVAISRATLPPTSWTTLAATLVETGGLVGLLLAREEAPRLPGAAVERDEAYTWPLTGAARRAVLYRVSR